jgi:ATP-dependent helicase/nuclease subunit A
MTMQPTLFDRLNEPDEPAPPPDQAARLFAVDPANHVVLEASAGTGKTSVLVDRYVRLVMAGVDPRHILAMTFTRKAAAEMRERVLAALRRHAETGAISRAQWAKLRPRLADVEITTIDGFCFSLLREFPLEADVDPAFEVADETEMARFVAAALDRTMRMARALVEEDEYVRLLLVRLKQPVLREALTTLVDRRHVSVAAVARFLERGGRGLDAAGAARRLLGSLAVAFDLGPRAALIDDGPRGMAEFERLADDIVGLETVSADDLVRVQHIRSRIEAYFLTKAREPRRKLSKPFTADRFATPAAKKRHEEAIGRVSPAVAGAIDRFAADLDYLCARGLFRVLLIAVNTYKALLDEHALLDFGEMLDRAVALIDRQEEFARSRLKLQSRYHHLLVDEFQDTSRQQWRLVEGLIRAWAEGEGAADASTSVFIVGDRKQSIYRFRHAEVTLLDEAAEYISALRRQPARRAITTSFRAVPELLAFVNALSTSIESGADVAERWAYDDRDRFPTPEIAPGALRDGEPVLGLVAATSMPEAAEAVADEVVRLLSTAVVRDRSLGTRPARPEDIAILFRARAGHQYFEHALDVRGVRSYVYKGLGFFDAPEVQDLQALLRFLAYPESDLDAAAFLRSRFVRVSDDALVALAPAFSDALLRPGAAPAVDLSPADAALLARARSDVTRWLALARHIPASELVDLVMRESAYAFEIRGSRRDQARENLKKVRALIRRVESRGYATLDRLAAYFDTLRAGDDSNAVIEAAGAVNLMTIHAAKGLEFPIVFVVNLHAAGRGRTGPIVVERGPDGEPDVAFRSNEATRLEDARESEELRRLFYVAITRARDRLYLAADVDDQARLRRGARSLASLLPVSLGATFQAAAITDAATVDWLGERERFTFRACRPRSRPRSNRQSRLRRSFCRVLSFGPPRPNRVVSLLLFSRPRGAASDPTLASSERWCIVCSSVVRRPMSMGRLASRAISSGPSSLPTWPTPTSWSPTPFGSIGRSSHGRTCRRS